MIFKFVTLRGVKMDVIPSTAKTLNIFEPIKFPIEIFFSFFNKATSEVASSGMLVPTDTTVIPIILSLTPK